MKNPSTSSSKDHKDLATIVVIGGRLPSSSIARSLPAYDFVIAADSGLHGAKVLGLTVDVVIGDMDSVDDDVLDEAESDGVIVKRAPRNKDATDTELALLYAAERGSKYIVVVTGSGGRLDHQLGVLNVLLHPRLADIKMEMFWDTAQALLLRGPGIAVIRGRHGEMVGLLPIGGDAIGITTDGLAWPLEHESIPKYSTRGVSNELVGNLASISLSHGHLLIVRPHALEN